MILGLFNFSWKKQSILDILSERTEQKTGVSEQKSGFKPQNTVKKKAVPEHILLAENISRDISIGQLPDVISVYSDKLVANYANGQTKTFVFSNYGMDKFGLYIKWLNCYDEWESNFPTNEMEGFVHELNRILNAKYNIEPNIETITHTYSEYARETRLYYMGVTMRKTM